MQAAIHSGNTHGAARRARRRYPPLEAVKVLVEAGAKVNVKDRAWGGTPIGWAHHYLEEGQGDRPDRQYAEIAACLSSHDGDR